MILSPAPDKYIREVVQEYLNEIFREDSRNLKRDVNETINGSLTVNGLIAMVGGGLDFPTTQVSSSNPNVLDDYEEGTYTPVFDAASTSPTGIAYTTQFGAYVKIGSVVFIRMRVKLSSKGTGGAGSVFFVGLPFTPAAHPSGLAVSSYDNINLSAGFTDIGAGVDSGATRIAVNESGDNVVAGAVAWSQFANTSDFVASGLYFV